MLRHSVKGLAALDSRFGAGHGFLPYLAKPANSVVFLTAIGALWDDFLALLGRAFPGRMPCRAGPAGKLLVWALSMGVPIFLALHAHSTPSLSTIGPIGVNLGLPNRSFGDGRVGHQWTGEFDHERTLPAARFDEPAEIGYLCTIPPGMLILSQQFHFSRCGLLLFPP
jgi:hypothetical protein